ncbi:dolichyl pyrophosphate man9 c2 alpha-glucosyltransferase-like, partial [Nannochloropsis oceanica]
MSSGVSDQPVLGAGAAATALSTRRGIRKARTPPRPTVDEKDTEGEEEKDGAAEIAGAATAPSSPSLSSPSSSSSSSSASLLLTLTITLFALLVRHAISLHSYSGMHTPPLHGDYEAQRHWMEVTLHVPLRDWYRNTPMNDLEHWGLDYPPLTAYVSYICGLFCKYFEPASMDLRSSWGYETATHKALMRLTVLVLDLLLFFPALFLLASSLPSLPPSLPPSLRPA